MATFEERVEGIIQFPILSSTSPSQAELTEFLKDGVIDVTNRCIAINPAEIQNFQRTTTSDSQGVGDTVGAKIIAVLREAGADGSSDGSTAWRDCRRVSPSLQSRLVDINSLNYASQYNPVYIIDDNNTINVYPTPSANNGMKIFYVNNVPTDKTNGAALTYAHSDIKYFPNDKVYLVVLYASIQFLNGLLNAAIKDNITDPDPADLTAPTLSVSTQPLPAFTVPDSFVLPVPPVGIDVDFTSVGSIESFVSPLFSIPTLDTIADMSLPTIPSSITLDPSSIDTNGLTNPTLTPPVMHPPDWNDVNTWITTEEDSEMSAARVQEIQGKVTEYTAKMQEAQAQFNKESAILNKDLQVAMQNASTFEQGKLGKYSADIQSYQAEVNSEIQKWTSQTFGKPFQEWQQKYQGQLQQYQADLQKETSRVGSSVQDFQAQVSKALQKYQAETGYDMSKYQAEIQANAQKYQADLSKNQTDFETSIAKYTSDIQRVSSDNQTKIGKFSAEIQNYSAQVQKDIADLQMYIDRYNTLRKEYNEAFMMMNPQQQQQQQQERRR